MGLSIYEINIIELYFVKWYLYKKRYAFKKHKSVTF